MCGAASDALRECVRPQRVCREAGSGSGRLRKWRERDYEAPKFAQRAHRQWYYTPCAYAALSLAYTHSRSREYSIILMELSKEWYYIQQDKFCKRRRTHSPSLTLCHQISRAVPRWRTCKLNLPTTKPVSCAFGKLTPYPRVQSKNRNLGPRLIT